MFVRTATWNIYSVNSTGYTIVKREVRSAVPHLAMETFPQPTNNSQNKFYFLKKFNKITSLFVVTPWKVIRILNVLSNVVLESIIRA